MPHRSSSRIFVITLILLAVAAVAVGANWFTGFAFSESSASEAEVNKQNSAAEPRAVTTPLNAITAFDAALIYRHVVALPPPFNADQMTVADVSGVNGITTLDAASVTTYVVNVGSWGSTGTVFPPGLLMGDVSGAGPHYDGSPGTVAVSSCRYPFSSRMLMRPRVRSYRFL